MCEYRGQYGSGTVSKCNMDETAWHYETTGKGRFSSMSVTGTVPVALQARKQDSYSFKHDRGCWGIAWKTKEHSRQSCNR